MGDHLQMTEVSPLPARGDVLVDARDFGRELRVSWHHEAGIAVISIWRFGVCTATFQLPREDVPELVDVLVQGLLPRASRAQIDEAAAS